MYKRHRDNMKAAQEKQRHKMGQINVVLAGKAFNIESMLHAVFEQNHIAYKELQIKKEMVNASASLRYRCTNTRR
jgi:hypothetical protein